MKDKKKIMILMNCHGIEIMKYMTSVKYFNDEYDVERYASNEYLHCSEIILNKIRKNSYSIIIINNIKNYPDFTPKNIKTIADINTKIIVLEYYRFDGFYGDIYYDFSSRNCIVPNMLQTSYEDFYNRYIADAIILKQFNDALIFLKNLDDESDIKIYDFFIQNYKYKRLFQDRNHPTTYFFWYVTTKIFEIIDLNCKLEPIYDNCYATVNHPFFYNKYVKLVLGLQYDDVISNLNNIITTEKDIYEKNKNRLKSLSS